jgi:hypothetical protein
MRVYVVTFTLEFTELTILFSLIVAATGYFVRQGIVVHNLQKERKNHAEILKVIITYVGESMDKDKLLEFITKMYTERGRW